MHAVNDSCSESVQTYGGLRVKVLTALEDNYMYIVRLIVFRIIFKLEF